MKIYHGNNDENDGNGDEDDKDDDDHGERELKESNEIIRIELNENIFHIDYLVKVSLPTLQSTSQYHLDFLDMLWIDIPSCYPISQLAVDSY